MNNFFEDQQTYEHYRTLFKKVVNYYTRRAGLTSEQVKGDLYQTAWLELLQYVQDNNKLPDDKLITTIAIRSFIDTGRREKTQTGKIAKSLDEPIKDGEGNQIAFGNTVASPDSEKAIDNAVISDLLDTVKDDEQKLKYVQFYLEKSGLSDKQTANIAKGGYLSGYTDTALARDLGFRAANDPRWLRFRDSMDSYINAFFGTNLTRRKLGKRDEVSGT